MIFITGAAGFIGSNFAHYLASKGIDEVVILDKLTYAGDMDNLYDLKFPVKGVDLAYGSHLEELFKKYKPRFIFHFAAETHVDNSINDVYPFVDANVIGTVNLLDLSVKYEVEKFHHISTDEVYGALGYNDPPFTEETPYDPQNPYSASKAASDHFVMAYHNTYGLPVVITNCSNNYGPRQHKEKLIPKTITNIMQGKKTIINSDYRFSYDEVQEILEKKTKTISRENALTGKEYKIDKNIYESIIELNKLAKKIRKKRIRKRWSISS